MADTDSLPFLHMLLHFSKDLFLNRVSEWVG